MTGAEKLFAVQDLMNYHGVQDIKITFKPDLPLEDMDRIYGDVADFLLEYFCGNTKSITGIGDSKCAS